MRHNANLYHLLFKCRENMVCHNANLSHILLKYNGHDFRALPIELCTATNIIDCYVSGFNHPPSLPTDTIIVFVPPTPLSPLMSTLSIISILQQIL